MQFAIELPDELGQKLLQHENVTQFIQEAIQLKLLKEEQLNIPENKSFLKLINNIEPVKASHSSIEMVNILRQNHD